MCKHAENRVKVVVTGEFDGSGFSKMFNELDTENGCVQSAFFAVKGGNMGAAATFMVDTGHDEKQIRALLEQVCGGNEITTEANHA